MAILSCGAVFAQQSSDPNIARARDILEKGLKSGNPDTRRAVVVSISLVGAHEKAVSELADVLKNDKDVPCRIAAIGSLASFKDPKLVAIIETGLKDPVPEVNFAAAKALFEFKQPAGKAFLLGVLEGQDKATSGFITSEKRDVFRLLKTPSETFTGVLANEFTLPGVGSGFESELGLASSPETLARAAVILILDHQTDATTWNAILAALDDKEMSVRAAAAHAVAVHNDPALKGKLVPLLDDGKDAVKFRAAAGYLRLAFLPKKS